LEGAGEGPALTLTTADTSGTFVCSILVLWQHRILVCDAIGAAMLQAEAKVRQGTRYAEADGQKDVGENRRRDWIKVRLAGGEDSMPQSVSG